MVAMALSSSCSKSSSTSGWIDDATEASCNMRVDDARQLTVATLAMRIAEAQEPILLRHALDFDDVASNWSSSRTNLLARHGSTLLHVGTVGLLGVRPPA